jgi:hypothetical protein
MSKKLQLCFDPVNSVGLQTPSESPLTHKPLYFEYHPRIGRIILYLRNQIQGPGCDADQMNTIDAKCLTTKQSISYYENKVRSCGKIIERTFLKFRDCIGIQSRSVSPRGQLSANRFLASGATTFRCNF